MLYPIELGVQVFTQQAFTSIIVPGLRGIHAFSYTRYNREANNEDAPAGWRQAGAIERLTVYLRGAPCLTILPKACRSVKPARHATIFLFPFF